MFVKSADTPLQSHIIICAKKGHVVKMTSYLPVNFKILRFEALEIT